MVKITQRRSRRARPLQDSRRFYRPREIVIAITDDPIQELMAVIIFGILALILAISGLCLWPYFFTRAFEGGGFDAGSVFGKTIIMGGISVALGAAVATYMSWFHDWADAENFSLVRIWMIVYAVEMIANFILMPVMGIDMLGAANSGGWSSVLKFLFHGIVGILMPIVPSFLLALIGYCVNTTWFALHRQ